MPVDSSEAIPVQAVLKLIVDRVGSDAVEKSLEKQEASFGKIESAVDRIGTKMGSVGRSVAELAGVAGVGALVDKFVRLETSASNVALAMGKVSGGSGAYRGIGQEMLGVQARTGVSVSEQESALRSLAMSVGLSPKAGQAGMLAEVIAGYSKVTGLPTSTLGSILGPMLQAEGRTSSASASAYTLGEARANLSAFPGSQIEGMLPVVSGLATQSALGTAGGAGGGTSVGGIAALINTISASGGVLRQSGVAQAAAEGIGGTLQGAYQNPRVYAFMKMAGIDFKEQQLGFNSPQVQEKLVREAMRQYPGDSEAAWKERRLLYLELGQGEAGADALERFEAATLGGGIHVKPPPHRGAPPKHPQTETTPGAFLSKLEGTVLGGLTAHPLGTVAGGAALYSLKKLWPSIKGLFGGAEEDAAGAATEGLPGGAFDLGAAAAAVRAAAGGGSAVAGDAGSGLLGLLGDTAGAAVGGVAGGLFNTNPLGFLGLSNPTGGPLAGNATGGSKQALIERGNAKAVQAVAAAAQKKFGAAWSGPQGQKWMEHQLYKTHSSYSEDMRVGLGESISRPHPQEATHLLQQALASGAAVSGSDEGQKFTEAVKKFSEAVEKLTKVAQHDTAYTGGASMHSAAYMGAPAVAAMQATVPGMVMAAFLGRSGSNTTPMGATPSLTSYSPSGSGWNSVLEKYSGNSYGLSHVEQLARENPGGGAHPGDRRTIEADAKKYGIPFNVLWGIYGAESSFGKAASNFGLTGQFPGTGTSGNFNTDARMSAEDVAHLMKQAHLTVNVKVNGSKVQKHQAKVGGASWA
jgi:hypothetical protein